MRSIVKTIEHDSRSDVFRIVLLGDVHLGAAACDEKLLSETVAYIRDTPNTLWVGMGDMADAIPRQDKRFSEETLAKWLHGKSAIVKGQRDRIIESMQPIGHKCLAYLQGNHELYIAERYSSDIYLDVIEAIRPTPETELQMGMAGFLVVKFRRYHEAGEKGGTRTLTLWLHHGYGGGDLMGGVALKLERMGASYTADVYAMGHVHKRMSFTTTVTGATRAGTITAQNRFHVLTGSFLKTALPLGTTYTERFGKKPVALGAVELEFRPGADGDGIRVIV